MSALLFVTPQPGVLLSFFSPLILIAVLCDSRANSEIAQVRAKAKQEQAAYQASLRKEQMKVDSLERTLEQKVGHTSFSNRTPMM